MKAFSQLSEVLTASQLCRVIQNITSQFGNDYLEHLINKFEYPADFISSGFSWPHSIEGNEYWAAIAQKVHEYSKNNN